MTTSSLVLSSFVVVVVGLVPSAVMANAPSAASNTNILPADFIDRSYRIERQFVPTSTASKVMKDLVYSAVPNNEEAPEDFFSMGAVRKIGDSGNTHVEQYDISEYSSALQNFTTPEYHAMSGGDGGSGQGKHSLVYYLEEMEGPPLERAEEVISTVASHSFLQQGTSSVHLYMSSPGSAALKNHTDTTDIAVLQLHGAKEWLLCTAEYEETPPDQEDNTEDKHSFLRTSASDFSRKLNTCTAYTSDEMGKLDCKREILYPGDVLFLPRRVVHSARALSDSFSAHLTFGYGQEEFVCQAADFEGRRVYRCDCDEHCNTGCNNGWWSGCDDSCNWGCDHFCAP